MKFPVAAAAILFLFLSSCVTAEKTATVLSPPPAPIQPESVVSGPEKPEEDIPDPALAATPVLAPQTSAYLSVPERVFRKPATETIRDQDEAIHLSLSRYPLSTKIWEIPFRLSPPDAAVFVSSNGVLNQLELTDRLNDIQYFSSNSGAVAVKAAGYESLVVPITHDEGVVEIKLEKSGGPLTKVGEITTGHQPKSVRFTPDGQSVVVTNLGDFTAAGQFSLASMSNIRNLQVPEKYRSDSGFVETLMLQSRNELWVTQMTIDTIHIFSLDKGVYKESIILSGKWPKVLVASSDESRVYASCWDSNKVVEIDPAGRSEIRSFSTSGTPRGMALSPDGNELLVAIFSSSGIDRISLETGLRLATYDADPERTMAMRHIVHNPQRGEYYITAMGAERVYRMSEDGEWLGWWPVGDKPNTCVVSPDGTRLFVSCRGPNNPDIGYLYKGYEFGKIFIINLVSGEVEDWIWGRDQPTGLDISPDGRYIAFSDFLSNRLEIYRVN